MNHLFTSDVRTVILDRIRRGVAHRVTPEFARTVTLDVRDGGADRLLGHMVMSLTAEVLTEKLPPHTVTTRVQYEHPEAVGTPGVTVDARFARPIDHLVATYRGRWWARLLRLHRRKIEYTFVPVPYLVTRPVQCDHVITTHVRNTWTYPRATMVLPAEDFGRVVLDAGTVDHFAHPSDEFSDAVRNLSRAYGYGNEGWR